MISCAVANTMRYTINTTEKNLLTEETVSIRCQIRWFRLTDCQITLQNNSCYYGEGSHQVVYSAVTCSPGKNFKKSVKICQWINLNAIANCADGDIRLADGSTDREGRVEVCVDGRWGTVCGGGTQRLVWSVQDWDFKQISAVSELF